MDKESIPFNRKRIVFYGALVWLLWMAFYAVFFRLQVPTHNWSAAVISSVGTYTWYALISVLIWFICRRIPFGVMPAPLLMALHFVLSLVVSALWLFFVYGTWYLFAGDAIFRDFNFRDIIGWQFLFGAITYLLIVGIFYTIIYYRRFREKELGEAELKILTRDAELEALKMQINPHFLFNALNSVSALVRERPDQAREMIAGLSDLLRATLEMREKTTIPLRDELDLARQYLDIESIRFRDRLTVSEDVAPDLLDNLFPALTLQPLLENAVKHGVASHRGKGTVQLSLEKMDGAIRCTVTNKVEHGSTVPFPDVARGTGLSNIRRRLDLLYGEAALFTVDASKPGTFTVTLHIPLEPHETG